MVEDVLEYETEDEEIKEEQKSVEERKSEAIVHKDSALNRLDISFNKNIELEKFKRSHLLAYWITTFSNYHDNEDSFDATTLKTFKRGDIIKVNLGFNIGNELGGLHYCVVLNKNDNPYSKTLNIIPLTSAKENKDYNKSTCIDLGDELYSLLNTKADDEATFINQKLFSLKDNVDLVKETFDSKALLRRIDFVEKLYSEISHMKHGSIAYIHQITTISKQRIFRTPILSGIHLSNNSLDLIDEKIKKLFTK